MDSSVTTHQTSRDHFGTHTAGHPGQAEVMELPGICHINTSGITGSLVSGAMAYGDQLVCSAGSMQSWGQVPFPKTCLGSLPGCRQALIWFWPPSDKPCESCMWPGSSRSSRVTSSWKVFPSRGWCRRGDPSRCADGGRGMSISAATVSPRVLLLLPASQQSSGPHVAPLCRH